MVNEKLLVKYGFVKNKYRALYNEKLEAGEIDKWVKGLSSKELSQMADQEEAELHLDNPTLTGLPNPTYFERIIYEEMNQYIENAYYFIISHLKQDWAFDNLYKIADIFAASTGSSFFGVSEQRLGMQQDKAAQYLKGISEMVKALFQLVRELRIIDERLGYYNHTFERNEKNNPKEAVGSEITLKGIWVDQVEGGVKNAASVYGLAQTVGFTILPDLFFRVRADDIGMHKILDNREEYDRRIQKVLDDIDAKSDALAKEGFNEKVIEVLKRKLAQYYMWKMRTYKELEVRRNFTIKYLRQHYDTIKLYMGWIKPYLKNIKRLQLDQSKMDSANLIGAFEGAMIEIEILATGKKSGEYRPCILVRFEYRTRPALTYVQEGYQRGPAHTGEFDMILRGYTWTEKQINNYRAMKDEEDLELLSSINESVQEAMNALSGELKKYLEEGGEIFEEKEEKKKETKRPSSAEPFTALFSGFKEIFSPLIKLPGLPGFGVKKEDIIKSSEDKERAGGTVKRVIYQTFKNYKKAHGLISW